MCSTLTVVARIPVCMCICVCKSVHFIFVWWQICVCDIIYTHTWIYLGINQEERRVPRNLIAREDRREDTSESYKWVGTLHPRSYMHACVHARMFIHACIRACVRVCVCTDVILFWRLYLPGVEPGMWAPFIFPEVSAVYSSWPLIVSKPGSSSPERPGLDNSRVNHGLTQLAPVPPLFVLCLVVFD